MFMLGGRVRSLVESPIYAPAHISDVQVTKRRYQLYFLLWVFRLNRRPQVYAYYSPSILCNAPCSRPSIFDGSSRPRIDSPGGPATSSESSASSLA